MGIFNRIGKILSAPVKYLGKVLFETGQEIEKAPGRINMIVGWQEKRAMSQIDYDSLAKEMNDIASHGPEGQTKNDEYTAERCRNIAESLLAREIYNIRMNPISSLDSSGNLVFKRVGILGSQFAEYIPEIMREILRNEDVKAQPGEVIGKPFDVKEAARNSARAYYNKNTFKNNPLEYRLYYR